MLERFEYLVCMLGLAACILLPAWYWLFADKPKFYDFQEAKKIMEKEVVADHRVTVYCEAAFDADKNVYPPYGFAADGIQETNLVMDWEHAVPVAAFGPNFSEWQEGSPECVHKGRPYKGRKCAQLANSEFRKIAGDMYNLFPAIAIVNSRRGDKPYGELPGKTPSFGSCKAKIGRRSFEPPDPAKGRLARATLYMDGRYDKFELTPPQKQLYESWSRQFPVDEWECVRARRIEKLQGNENSFVKEPCETAGLW